MSRLQADLVDIKTMAEQTTEYCTYIQDESLIQGKQEHSSQYQRRGIYAMIEGENASPITKSTYDHNYHITIDPYKDDRYVNEDGFRWRRIFYISEKEPKFSRIYRVRDSHPESWSARLLNLELTIEEDLLVDGELMNGIVLSYCDTKSRRYLASCMSNGIIGQDPMFWDITERKDANVSEEEINIEQLQKKVATLSRVIHHMMIAPVVESKKRRRSM